ncbi:hypothetical protein F5X99DRAFT_422960 [Biscogniauxia marginata]|nr:hypothetical protein F5X99DRAFT_422960 [Biscogniauxia marginata]
MPTPGLMFAEARVLDPRKTPDELFNRFYNEESLPDVLATGQAAIGLRYKNARDTSTIPYLALYPVADVSTLWSPESARLSETRGSRVLGCDDTHALVGFNLHAYEKIQTYEACPPRRGGGGAGSPRTQTLLCAALEPAEGADADLDAWYREEHLDLLAASPAYRRSTRYRRAGGDGGARPRYLALHEYACAPADLPVAQLAEASATPWGKRILNGAKIFDRQVFELIEVQGDLSLNL